MSQDNKKFMFDTSALNQIVNDSYDEMQIYQSKFKGFEYYFSEIQVSESIGNIKKERKNINNDFVSKNDAELTANLLRIVSKLQTKYVGQIATPRRWVLDGTYTLLKEDTNCTAIEMFEDILNDNDYQYYNDAMIALLSVTNNCILVTNDKRLFKKVIKYFPDLALKYDDYFKLVKDF